MQKFTVTTETFVTAVDEAEAARKALAEIWGSPALKYAVVGADGHSHYIYLSKEEVVEAVKKFW
ncbi:hypothetical protein [Pararhizobium sp. O133]|uniref:hypothetical protein n=1 Tax=Pararhizobium sp. O133 TaxID=3449278 RepID=UPI003F683DD0